MASNTEFEPSSDYESSYETTSATFNESTSKKSLSLPHFHQPQDFQKMYEIQQILCGASTKNLRYLAKKLEVDVRNKSNLSQPERAELMKIMTPRLLFWNMEKIKESASHFKTESKTNKPKKERVKDPNNSDLSKEFEKLEKNWPDVEIVTGKLQKAVSKIDDQQEHYNLCAEHLQKRLDHTDQLEKKFYEEDRERRDSLAKSRSQLSNDRSEFEKKQKESFVREIKREENYNRRVDKLDKQRQQEVRNQNQRDANYLELLKTQNEHHNKSCDTLRCLLEMTGKTLASLQTTARDLVNGESFKKSRDRSDRRRSNDSYRYKRSNDDKRYDQGSSSKRSKNTSQELRDQPEPRWFAHGQRREIEKRRERGQKY